ncbi:MAG: AAA family ATPase [Acidimicrobiaceae bacterium]|nr:AAA family ATPase [Acidimicrobiaceae bacterium]
MTTLAAQENGSLPVRELFNELAERLRLGPEDLVSTGAGTQRKFERDAYFDVIPAVKAGWLKRQGGVWTITAEGREAIARYPDADSLQRAARALYLEWRQSRPTNAEPAPRAAFDRSDPETARAIVEAMYADDAVREACLAQAALSIELADAVSHTSWSTTLFRRKIRLNVGRIYVLTFEPRTIRLVADQTSLPPTDRPDSVTVEPFDVVTLDNLVELAFPPDAMESVSAWAGAAHAAAIRAAATAVPRSPFSQAFSAGVTALLRDEAGLGVPDPVSTVADVESVGDLEDALEEFDRDAARLAAERAEMLRRSIVARFPIDQWPALPLERYALGNPDHDNFCYVMEFESEALCSMRGGSARKHAIYRKASGDWYYDDSYPSVEAAWEAVRGAFVEAFRLARTGDFEAVDDLRPIRSAAALRTKALYVYFPDELLPITSSAHLAHFVALLGGSVGQRGTVEANRTLLQLLRERPEFEGWSLHEMATFLYQWADPRKARLVVKVAPGERAAYWDECRDNGYICIGWDELGDLSRYASQEEFRKAFNDQFSEEYRGNKSKLSVKANEVWTFRELEPGDTVIANRGTSQVVGIGTVIEPGYVWRPEREIYKHTVSMQWTDITERTLDPPVTSWFGSTVAKVPGDLYQRIIAPEGTDSGVPPPPVSPEPVLPEILSGLQRRGQVVLYGPPGTGKTYHARRFAVWWLLSRAGAPEASWVLGDRAALAERERSLSTAGTTGVPQLSMITFHPSYSYEDFVEGYKPRPTGGRGGLELELRDGIFKRICQAAANDPRPHLLLIDEINRGNLPKIFGELITLLELDKRGISVLLPYSGETFSIPPNVFIIGTMNTADRSIRLLDAALRRRFAFIELLPDPEVLQGAAVDRLALDAFLLELNQRILKYVGREKQIGHSFFLDREGKPITRSEDFVAHFISEVLPILQEYAFEDYNLLAQLLGDGVVDGELQVIRPDVLQAPGEFVEALRANFGTTD